METSQAHVDTPSGYDQGVGQGWDEITQLLSSCEFCGLHCGVIH
jgi:hypothetical protein